MSTVTAYDEDMRHTLAQYLMEDFPFHATNSSLMRPDSLLAIEGIGKTYGRLFREIGIEDRSDLLQSAVSAESRKELADATGISEQLISRWVRQQSHAYSWTAANMPRFLSEQALHLLLIWNKKS